MSRLASWPSQIVLGMSKLQIQGKPRAMLSWPLRATDWRRPNSLWRNDSFFSH